MRILVSARRQVCLTAASFLLFAPQAKVVSGRAQLIILVEVTAWGWKGNLLYVRHESPDVPQKTQRSRHVRILGLSRESRDSFRAVTCHEQALNSPPLFARDWGGYANHQGTTGQATCCFNYTGLFVCLREEERKSA